MIKLIATDVDGTLVEESSPDITPAQIELFRELSDAGYRVTVASGRQYKSVSTMFAPVGRELCYIVENGAHILIGDKTIHHVRMKREYVEGIMADLRALYPEGCHVVASTTVGCFLETKDEAFISRIRDRYRNHVLLTDDILGEDVEYVKLAVFREGSIRQIGEQNLIPKWKDKVKATMAGEEWVDFMDATVDKGRGLKILAEKLGIGTAEVMAFGDNENDIGLMQAAGESYAVGNAVDKVKAAAGHVCGPYWEDGVSQVLRTLLQS
ncbi:MAG: HAD family hydrolase [Lachnospiraceae bacterium]|nr:HAD family hydrolase [Lachnospiraceae bacterium]